MQIRPLVPAELDLDLHPDEDGVEKAWVGVVPFRMEAIRPRGLPAVPPVSRFPETNVRTYVSHRGEPGVWFFSLEAASPTACRIARRFFGLPYHEATMTVSTEGDQTIYDSRRWSDGAACQVEANVGAQTGPAAPGTFEFWLVERYLLFSQRRGQIVRGQVHHAPYQLRKVKVQRCEQNLTDVAGIPGRPFCHWAASDGVDVSVYAPTPV